MLELKLVPEQLYKNFGLEFIDESWKDFFEQQIEKGYFIDLLKKVEEQYKNHRCCPKQENVFRLFHKISLPKVKVIVIGQDPYHQLGVADGIAFSTQKERYIPSSLRNIFLKFSQDLNREQPLKGDLLPWVKEGVFLINTSLTVRADEPLSHSSFNSNFWETFILSLIEYLKKANEKLVWVFWGGKALSIKNRCEISDELSVISSHPSPYSADKPLRQYRPFLESRPFFEINERLISLEQGKIDWLVILPKRVVRQSN